MSTSTPAQFTRSIPLSRAADPKLRDALAAGRLGAFRRAWLAALSKPRRRASRRLSDKTWLAMWSAPTAELSDRERQLAAALEVCSPRQAAKKPARRTNKSSRSAPASLNHVLAQWSVAVSGRPAPWETLAVAEVLFRVGEHVEAETFAGCLAVLARSFGRSSSGNMATADANAPAAESVPLECELPWVISLLLSPLNGAARLQRTGMLALQQLLRHSTDPHGLPTGSALRQLPDVLRTCARCTAWARIFHQSLWSDYQSHLQCLTEAAVLLQVPPQPSATEAVTDVPPSPDSCLLPVLQQLLDDDSGDHSARLHKLLKKLRRPITSIRVPKRWRPGPTVSAPPDTESPDSTSGTAADTAASASSGTAPRPEADGPASVSLLAGSASASWQSDDGRLALLRSSANADADLVLVDWHSGTVHLQVHAAGTLVFSGYWHWSARLNEELAAGPAAWRCSCWFDDAECVFLELEADCGNGLRGVRQIMLA
ncbi:MAG: hypothetical protein ACKO2P_02185, partial [Planctomycetota bacterium]